MTNGCIRIITTTDALDHHILCEEYCTLITTIDMYTEPQKNIHQYVSSPYNVYMYHQVNCFSMHKISTVLVDRSIDSGDMHDASMLRSKTIASIGESQGHVQQGA